jgi:linoleoyl-CoA desaturase
VPLTQAAPAKKQLVKFVPRTPDTFFSVAKKRVDEYFKENNISKNANRKMYIKTASMIAMYFVPCLFIITGALSSSLVLFYGAWALMGLGILGIGCSVMHDSNHGSYSTNKKVNFALGYLLNIIGGYSPNWRIQHNILHHTYTNLDGLDEDLEGTKLIRMSPHKPLLKVHRYQYIYAWFLYSIMNLFWVTVKDYRKLVHYHKEGLLVKEKLTLTSALVHLTLLKAFYFSYALVLPLLFSGMAWYHVVLGFVGMHLMAGLGLAAVFQPAHVMESAEYPTPTEGRVVENTWAIHQVLNTVNFAPNNTILSWFIGGLNFQIEHHLFPYICHIHYPALSRIIQKTAEEHGIPYQIKPTFRSALAEHGRMLKYLGRN